MTILIVSVSKVDNLDLFLETSFSLLETQTILSHYTTLMSIAWWDEHRRILQTPTNWVSKRKNQDLSFEKQAFFIFTTWKDFERISETRAFDLFVTIKRDLMSSSGVFPLGLSDHDLIYATIRLKNERPSPKIIKTRNYKRMDVEKFKHDLERTPFHIASIFEEPDDQLWVWERLFDDISNEHAPWREIKARSFSSPWITCFSGKI